MQTFILDNNLMICDEKKLTFSFLKLFSFRERENKIFRHVSTKFLSRTEKNLNFCIWQTHSKGKSIFHERLPFSIHKATPHPHPSDTRQAAEKHFDHIYIFIHRFERKNFPSLARAGWRRRENGKLENYPLV